MRSALRMGHAPLLHHHYIICIYNIHIHTYTYIYIDIHIVIHTYLNTSLYIIIITYIYYNILLHIITHIPKCTDLIRTDDGAEPVSDDHSRLALADFAEAGHHAPLSVHVQRCGLCVSMCTFVLV